VPLHEVFDHGVEPGLFGLVDQVAWSIGIIGRLGARLESGASNTAQDAASH
jgi:hypothetical protein